MSTMSQNKNPRRGQAQVVIFRGSNPKLKVLPVKLPGGYGKTGAIALCYQQERQLARCDRLLVVVANDVQVRQIQNEFAAECANFGFEIKGGAYPCDANHNALRMSRENLVEVFVTTIQRVSSTNRQPGFDILRALLIDGHKWMLAPDEYHHYSTGNDWGVALQRLVDLCVFTLATSATPDRDGEPTIFGKPLIEITYAEAIAEGALKSMELRYYKYRVVTEDIPTGKTIEFTTDELREEIGTEDVDVFLQKRHLRLHPDYINPVLRGTLDHLLVDKVNLHQSAQALVRAFSCRHAELLCQQINSLGYDLSCDWIGTKSELGGRSDEENQEVIDRFCPLKDIVTGERPLPKLDVLVQVGKAGEGFDSIMVSQIADLSLAALKGNANQSKQAYYRGTRWIPGGPPERQRCLVNVGTDHPLLGIANLDMVKWMDSNADFPIKNPIDVDLWPPDDGTEIDWIDPDWTKGFANLKQVELISVSKEDPVAAHLMEKLSKGSIKPEFWSWDNPEAVDQFGKLMSEYYKQQAQSRADLSEIQKQEHLRGKISKTVRVLTTEIIRRCSKPWDKYQDTITCINRKLASVCGSYVKKATSIQLQTSWDYLMKLQEQIKAGDIPTWVR